MTWLPRYFFLISSTFFSFGLTAAPNILVILADDLGTEALSSYGIGEDTAVTPNIDRLVSQGVRFEQFWAQPICSPTRAALLTGRYAFRTGVRGAIRFQWANMDAPVPEIPPDAPTELWYEPIGLVANGEVAAMRPPPPLSQSARGPGIEEIMLPQILSSLPQPYATAAVGKWHLADLQNGGLDHPNEVGFDYYSGGFFGAPSSYFSWRHLENGTLTTETGYYDRHINADAIDWISQHQENPWFMWLSYSNPHTPVHLPPTDLLNSDAKNLPPVFEGEENNRAYFYAQIEAMDTLLGQLFDSIPEEVMDNTYVIFLGDNGTVMWGNPSPPRDPARMKGTVYEGGVSVPLIVSGPGVPAGVKAEPLAHVVDLFSTILDLAGADSSAVLPSSLAIDSVSMAPHFFEPALPSSRDWVLTEGALRGVNWTAIRDKQFKLIVADDREEFYDLINDPNEKTELSLQGLIIDARMAYEQLKTTLTSLVSSTD